MIRIQNYLRLKYREGGRERPLVDCWGLYRLIVGEERGIWLAEFAGQEVPLSIARTTQRRSPVATGSRSRPAKNNPATSC